MSKSSGLNQSQIKECQAVHAGWNELFKMWTLPIIHALGFKEPARFNELKRRIEGISSTSLAERLSELEHQGVLERKVYPETPPRVEYSLTKKGDELREILGSLVGWAIRWSGQAPSDKEPILEKVPTPTKPKSSK